MGIEDPGSILQRHKWLLSGIAGGLIAVLALGYTIGTRISDYIKRIGWADNAVVLKGEIDRRFAANDLGGLRGMILELRD